MSLISVIIPTFNRSALVTRALDSVLSQKFRDFDVWVIDDGGTDESGKVVQQIANDNSEIRIHYMHTPNRGVAAARNYGIRHSKGKWIALLDSDDVWTTEKLKRQVDSIKQNPDVSIFHTGEIWIRKSIRVNPPFSYRKFGGEVFIKSLKVCMIGPSTALFSRALFENVDGFDEEFPVCEDYDFWLRVTSRYSVFLDDELLTVKYGGHSDQLSTAYTAMDYWRIRSMCRILQIRDLRSDKRSAVLDEIDRKGRILLKGYQKHGKQEKYEEVFTMIKSVNHGFPREISTDL